MATYVPNVGQYLPELKPFTPDYKFLSDVLQTKQTKYNTNYQQLNNAYSRILYSDLSRMDTNEARDQFVNKLQPTLEKISGLDLSLAQNVRAAEAVFDPFYENDLIMKDMVYTKNYNNNVRYAESLMFSTDKEKNERYWAEGIEFMKMKMDDFKNASQEQAMRMGLEQYVENPRLYKRAMEYLKGQGYTVEYDTISPDQNFIVKDVNGKNITKSALADLQMQFGKDPLINKAYYTQSYVSSRKFAKNQMEQGFVTSLDEGITKYNVGKLEAYKLSNAAKVSAYDAQIEKYNDALASSEEALKGRTPKPGSSDDLYLTQLKNEIEGTKMQREIALTNLEKATELLSSGNQELINSMGYNIEMQTNMMADLEQAALNYSQLTAKRTIKVNQAHLQTRKEQHEARMAEVKFNYDLLLEDKKTTEYEKRLKIKKELFPDGEGGKSKESKAKNAVLNLLPFNIGNFAQIISTTTEIPEDVSIIDVKKQEYLDEYNSAFDKKYEAFTRAYRNKYNLIKLPDGIKGIIQKDIYHEKDNNGNIFVKTDDLEKLLDYENNKEIIEDYIDKTYRDVIDKMKKSSGSITQDESNFTKQIKKYNREQIAANNKLKKLFMANHNNLSQFVKDGDIKSVPLMYTEDGKELSLEEYYKVFMDEVEDNIPRDDQYLTRGQAAGKDYIYVLKKDKLEDIKEGKTDGWVIQRKSYDKKGNYAHFLEYGLVPLLGTESKKKEMKTKVGDKIIKTYNTFNPEFYEKIEKKGDWQKRQMETGIIETNFMGQQKDARSMERDYKKRMFLKPGVPDYIKQIYEDQLKTVDKIYRGDFEIPEGSTLENMPYIFEGDLITGIKSVAPLQDVQVSSEEAVYNNEITIQNAGSLLQAIKDGATVRQVTNKYKKGNYEGDASPDNEIGRDEALDIIGRYLNGKLGDSGNLQYVLDYIPATSMDENSKYLLTRNLKKEGTTTSAPRNYISTIEISIPKSLDKNPLYEKNNPDSNLIDALIDPETNQYIDEYVDGSVLTINKNNGIYTVLPTLKQYNPLKDENESIDIYELFPSINIEFTSAAAANKARVDAENMLNSLEDANRNKKREYQLGFTKYLRGLGKTEAEEGDWENYTKSNTYKLITNRL